MRRRCATIVILGLSLSSSGCDEREGPGSSSDGSGGAPAGPGSSVGQTGHGGAAQGSGQVSATSQSTGAPAGPAVTVVGTSTGAGGTSGGLGGGLGAGGESGAGGGPGDPDLLPPVLVGTWGELGTEPGQFVEPSSVELDVAGNVYVAGHEDRLQKFTRDGAPLAIFGSSGVGEGEFDHPHGLAMDRSGGLLYAGDQENNRVQVLTTDGRFVRQWSDPQFQHIHDVGIDPLTGAIYVGDYESDIVQKFTDAGDFILELGGTGTAPGQFAGVWGLSTDSTGRLYAADAGNQRVQVFAAEGSFVDAWTGFDKPTGVFVDVLDRVYVCDATRDQIVILDADGARLATWDLAAIVGAPSEPEDIVITGDGDHIYLGDVLNHRVIHLSRAR
jgi:DNA-binding beta-propeller fold protein YncE